MTTIYLPFCLVGMVMMIIALFALISNNTTLQISQQKAMPQTSNNTSTALIHSQASLTTKTIPKSNFLMYENSAAGFRIQYPSNWTKNITNQGLLLFCPYHHQMAMAIMATMYTDLSLNSVLIGVFINVFLQE